MRVHVQLSSQHTIRACGFSDDRYDKCIVNGTSLEAYESNGYVVLKVADRDDLIFIIDPETGIVRDMNTANGFCGAYCYYDLQTDLAQNLGDELLSGQRVPTQQELNNFKNIQKDGYTQELQINSKDGKPPSKLGIALVLFLSALAVEGYYVEATDGPAYNWTNSSYNNTTTLIIRKRD